MSYSWPILSTVTFLPLLGALLIGVLRGDDESAFRNARYIALWTTLITFALGLMDLMRAAASRNIPVLASMAFQ